MLISIFNQQLNKIPVYVKDTNDFLSKLHTIKSAPDNTYLVSLDVKSLYTSIPKAEGMKALKESFDKHTSKKVATKVIPTFLPLILTLNDFVSNCKHYLQIKGCAMGTICAQSYANIFMDHFEKKYIYPFLEGLSIIYLRFIDGIFFIWTGNKEQLANLNTKYQKLASHFLIQKSLFKKKNLLQNLLEQH